MEHSDANTTSKNNRAEPYKKCVRQGHLSTSSSGMSSSRRPGLKAGKDITSEYARKSILSRFSPTSSPESSQLLQELTVNKLRFGSLGLYGRDESIQLLQECLQEISETATCPTTRTGPQASSQRQLVLISGPSGAGKTSLAKSIKKTARRRKGMFASGKFDKHARNEPYSGIAAACRELCRELRIALLPDSSRRDNYSNGSSPTSSNTLGSFREEMLTELGWELSFLTLIIPDLEELVVEQEDGVVNGEGKHRQQQEQEQKQNLKDTKSRFQYAFIRFFRVITRKYAPLVMVLDDLQWADPSSMELLQLLVEDQEISGLVLIGCYRSNEIGEKHLLHSITSNSQKETHQRGYHLLQIKLDSLSLEDTNQLLLDLLMSGDAESTLGLAKICHRKTMGNPFFLKHFLIVLEEKGYLEFNLGVCKWSWKLAEIESQVGASDNVVAFLKMKIDQLPPETLRCVQLAGCLGFVFSWATLELVWTECSFGDSEGGSGVNDLRFFFDIAITEGFLEESSNRGEYRWVHDNLQEACLAVVPPEELHQMRSRIAEILFNGLSDEELEWTIFVVTDLFNETIDSDSSAPERARLAKLNLRAAESAVKMSAFESAENYVKKGIAVLDEDCWQNQYDVALLLYSAAAETEAYFGHVDNLNYYCDAILKHGRSLDDKLRAYDVRMENLVHTKPAEAVDFGIALLKQLGCSLPCSKLKSLPMAIAGLLRAKLSSKEIGAETAQLREMKDPRKFEVMKLLDNMATATYMTVNPILFTVVSLRMLEITKKYGFCELSPVAYATTGLLFCGMMKDFKCGAAYAECALLLLQRTQTSLYYSRTIFWAQGFVLQVHKPVHTTLKPLLDGYQEGMKIGDTDSALCCITAYVGSAILSGTPLNIIAACCRKYLPQMKTLQKEMLRKRTILVWQIVNTLMGGSDDPEEMGCEVLTEDAVRGSSDLYLRFQAVQLFLYVHLGDFVRGADVVISLGSTLERKKPFASSTMTRPLFGGLCTFAAARTTGKRVYEKHAYKCLALVKSYIAKGNPNVRHWEALLNAEKAALKGRKTLAVKYYRESIARASRCGFLQDAAIGHLRLAQYADATLGDQEEASFRIAQAIKLYSEWGAHAVADRIAFENERLLEKSSHFRANLC